MDAFRAFTQSSSRRVIYIIQSTYAFIVYGFVCINARHDKCLQYKNLSHINICMAYSRYVYAFRCKICVFVLFSPAHVLYNSSVAISGIIRFSNTTTWRKAKMISGKRSMSFMCKCKCVFASVCVYDSINNMSHIVYYMIHVQQ